MKRLSWSWNSCVRDALIAVAVLFAVAPAVAEEPSLRPLPLGGEECNGWEISYTLAAKLRLTDTPLGAGNGLYDIGPGAVSLRFENRNGAPAGHAQMLSYRMRDHFTITTRALFMTTKVTTRTDTRATPDSCGIAAEGALAGDTLTWSGPVRGYRTDGTLTCEGAMCGKFGAPPAGKSELHIGPGPVDFKPFVFGKQLKSLKMDFAQVSKTKTPKQTAHVALAGRELRRRCVRAPPCR